MWALLAVALVPVIRLGVCKTPLWVEGMAASWWLDALWFGPLAWACRHMQGLEMSSGSTTFALCCALPGLRAGVHALGLRMLHGAGSRLRLTAAWGLQAVGLVGWGVAMWSVSTLSDALWVALGVGVGTMYGVVWGLGMWSPRVRAWRMEAMAGMFGVEHLALPLIVGLYLGDVPFG